jgi:nucleoside 2-deoxyribosyltransferase
MNLFCSMAITGEDPAAVTRRMQVVVRALETAGHTAYCQPLDPRMDEFKHQGVKVVMRYAFEKLEQCDGLVAIVTSERKSEGMLMEVGAALAAGKPVFLAQHESVNTGSHLPKLAARTVVWRTETDLATVLTQLV